MEPFHFILFGKKRLQTAPEAAGEALPNGALLSYCDCDLVKELFGSMFLARK